MLWPEEKSDAALFLPWGGHIAATTVMSDKRGCLEKKWVMGFMKEKSHLSLSSFYTFQHFLTLFFLSTFLFFWNSTNLTFFHLTLPDLLMSFPSYFLPLITSSYSSFLHESTCIHHICFCLSISCSVPFYLFLSLCLSLPLALSLSLSQQVKLMVTNLLVVRGKWLDPNSSRDVIFSPCAVARIKSGQRKPIEGWLTAREYEFLCVCVYMSVCVCVH